MDPLWFFPRSMRKRNIKIINNASNRIKFFIEFGSFHNLSTSSCRWPGTCFSIIRHTMPMNDGPLGLPHQYIRRNTQAGMEHSYHP